MIMLMMMIDHWVAHCRDCSLVVSDQKPSPSLQGPLPDTALHFFTLERSIFQIYEYI